MRLLILDIGAHACELALWESVDSEFIKSLYIKTVDLFFFENYQIPNFGPSIAKGLHLQYLVVEVERFAVSQVTDS